MEFIMLWVICIDIMVIYYMASVYSDNKTTDTLFELEEDYLKYRERQNIYTGTTTADNKKIRNGFFFRHRKYLK